MRGQHASLWSRAPTCAAIDFETADYACDSACAVAVVRVEDNAIVDRAHYYIRLIGGKHECRTVRLNEEIALNIGKGEKLVGIEILDAKEVLGAGKLLSVVLEGITASTPPLAVREKPSKKYGT